MPSKKYTTPIEPGRIYHIYNRGINHQTTFHTGADIRRFLFRFKHYLADYAEVLSYCILDNHYHFLIRIKKTNELPSTFSRQFGNMVLSYTHYYNRTYDYSGPIFHRCFKRLTVDHRTYFLMLFWYIHNNPVKHQKATGIPDYAYSSFRGYLYRRDPILAIDSGIEVFGSIENFLSFHRIERDDNLLHRLQLE